MFSIRAIPSSMAAFVSQSKGRFSPKNLKYISNKNERIETSCPSKRRLVEMVI